MFANVVSIIYSKVEAETAKPEFHNVVIVGGGSGGLAVASQLKRKLKDGKNIAIVEPSSKHYYQPLWTMVGAGVFKKEASVDDESKYIPKGCTWLKTSATTFKPTENSIVTADGKTVKYDYLVVATGVDIDLDKIKGLREAMGKDGVCTNYSYDFVEKTAEFMKAFKGGNAIFTVPDTPVKCGGAPQKIMWEMEDYVRQKGLRDKSNFMFCLPGTAMFGVKKYSDALEQMRIEKNVEAKWKHLLVEIDGKQKIAYFKNESNSIVPVKYDFIHVTPPMYAPKVVRESPLAAANGYVDVDKFTLQHNKYSNVFSLGDSANLPTSKTIAAITKQAPVVVANLTSVMENKPLIAKYDGYTSCPLVVSNNSLILAEFKYDNIPVETFGNWTNQAKPSRIFYFTKKYVFPFSYWHLFLKGRWYGPTTLFPPDF